MKEQNRSWLTFFFFFFFWLCPKNPRRKKKKERNINATLLPPNPDISLHRQTNFPIEPYRLRGDGSCPFCSRSQVWEDNCQVCAAETDDYRLYCLSQAQSTLIQQSQLSLIYESYSHLPLPSIPYLVFTCLLQAFFSIPSSQMVTSCHCISVLKCCQMWLLKSPIYLWSTLNRGKKKQRPDFGLATILGRFGRPKKQPLAVFIS